MEWKPWKGEALNEQEEREMLGRLISELKQEGYALCGNIMLFAEREEDGIRVLRLKVLEELFIPYGWW